MFKPKVELEAQEVTARHVKEAYRLLNKSIIRVDQPDVDLDEDDVPTAEEEAPEEAMDTNEQQETAKKQFKLSYEKYKKISFLIIEQKQVIEKVVDKLIYQDQVIVPLSNTAKGSAEEDPFLVVHPNYCYSDA